MLEISQLFNREQFLREAEAYTSTWVKKWHHPASGPSVGARRDTKFIGARPDLPFIAEQRESYMAMLDFFANTMILASQTDEADAALRAVHMALDRIMGGDGADHLRLQTLNDIFVRTLELRTKMEVTNKAGALVDHLKAVLAKLEDVIGEDPKK